MWNIYSVLSLFILSDGNDCQIWVSRRGRREKERMMVVERKTHASVCVAFCPKLYHRPRRHVFDQEKGRNTNETNGSREDLRAAQDAHHQKRSKKKKKKFVKYCFCHPKAQAVFKFLEEIIFPHCWVISHSSLQTYSALELGCVTCCYLSQPRTLLRLMAAQEHAMAHRWLRPIALSLFIFISLISVFLSFF